MSSFEKKRKELAKKYGTIIENVNIEHDGTIPLASSVPSGFISLDLITGIGGIPVGKIVEVFAPEGVGKTTFALQICKAFLANDDRSVVYIDVEEKLDRKYALHIVGENDRFYTVVGGPNNTLNAEITLNTVEGLINSSDVSLIVIDSVAMLLPKSEGESSVGDSLPGLRARLLGQAILKYAGIMNSNKTTVLFTNQLRAVMNTMGFGAKRETTPGGHALKFMSSMRISMRIVKSVKLSDGTPYGQDVRFTLVKNSLGTPYLSTVIQLVYGDGFDVISDIISMSVNLGIVEKSGSWYSYGGESYHGEARLREFLRENEQITRNISEQIMGAYNLDSKNGEDEDSTLDGEGMDTNETNTST